MDKTLRKNGRVMVTVSIALPKPDPKCKSMRTYYQTFERVLLSHAVKRLLPSAVRHSQTVPAADFEPYALTAKHTVTLHTDTLLSLYTDVTERAGGLTVLERVADTWNLSTGLPMGLGEFLPGKGFPFPGHRKRRIAAALEAEGTAPIPPLGHVRCDDFYLLPDKVILFWQPGAAGTVSQGVYETGITRTSSS
jgi:hypothetical protein